MVARYLWQYLRSTRYQHNRCGSGSGSSLVVVRITPTIAAQASAAVTHQRAVGLAAQVAAVCAALFGRREPRLRGAGPTVHTRHYKGCCVWRQERSCGRLICICKCIFALDCFQNCSPIIREPPPLSTLRLLRGTLTIDARTTVALSIHSENCHKTVTFCSSPQSALSNVYHCTLSASMATYRQADPASLATRALFTGRRASSLATIASHIIAAEHKQEAMRRAADSRNANARYTAFVEGRLKTIR